MRNYSVAIIPARKGSKRIPNKNIRPFSGQPMITYPIRAAQDSGLFDRILVSTDSEEISAIAQACGADVPFMRPAELSDDHTATAPVLKHALEWLNKSGTPASHACCIYATAPFVRASDIVQGLDILQDSKVATVFTVTSFTFPILRALKIKPDGKLAMFWPEHRLTRSQDLPEAYHDAGQLYWGKHKNYLKYKDFRKIYLNNKSIGFVMNEKEVQDIDTIEDLNMARIKFLFNKKKLA